MKTDEWFYEVFRRFPDQLLRLAGIRAEGRWRMESVTVKTTEKRIDAMLFRLDEPGMLVFAEFQGWSDRAIYWRLFREIATWYESRPEGDRPFVAVVLFLDASLDPGDPWLQPVPPNRLLKLTVAEGLEALGDDLGPLVIFRPLVVPDLVTAKEEAPRWMETLARLNLPRADATFLVEHLVYGLIRRFKELSLEEVAAMIQLAPLHETRAGRDLITIGEKRGEAKGVRMGKIQALEALLGLPETPIEVLKKENPEALDRRFNELFQRLQAGRT